MLSTIKTDEVDARIIALYGERMQPRPYKLPGDAILTLKQKRTVIRQLKKQLIATRNLKGSMEALPFFDPSCKKSVTKTITFLEKQITTLEEDLSVLAHKEYRKQMDLLTSIKGIGATLAAALIMATGGFTYFDNAKQLTRYLGLSPSYQQSGTSVNFKGHINRNGDSSLRSQLYVAACASLRCNKECRACYDRLRSNGKPGKVAVIAVANKLVRQAFAVGMDWGAEGELIELLSSDLLDGSSIPKIGYSAGDAGSLVFRCALKKAYKALVYRADTGGTQTGD